MRFSNTTKCFYPEDIDYQDLPLDVIEITQDEFILAMNRTLGETLDHDGSKLIIVPIVTPTPEERLIVIKVDRCAHMLNKYEEAINFDVTYNLVIYQSGQTTRDNLVEAVANYISAANPLPTPFTWRVKDNSDIVFTVVDIKALAALVGTQKTEAIYNYQAKKDEINAVDTGNLEADTLTINAINW